MKGDDIVLPQHYQFQMEGMDHPGLDPVVTHTKNSMGFRGPEWPDDFKTRLTIFAVGASTTEGYYLSDGKDWPSLLGANLSHHFPSVWINNAGLDGHSTFGHIRLMEQFIQQLRPSVILFLVGVADVGLGYDYRRDDRRLLPGEVNLSSPKEFLKSLAPYSEVVALGLNLMRFIRTSRHHFGHKLLPDTVSPSDDTYRPPMRASERAALLAKQSPSLEAFGRKLKRLVELSRNAGSVPVFITHPMLAGARENSDVARGLKGHRFPIWGYDADASTIWAIVEKYNAVTRKVAHASRVPLVDLARLLPKSTEFFYDLAHHTIAGAAEVARINSVELCPILAKRFPEHNATSCALKPSQR